MKEKIKKWLNEFSLDLEVIEFLNITSEIWRKSVSVLVFRTSHFFVGVCLNMDREIIKILSILFVLYFNSLFLGTFLLIKRLYLPTTY